MYGSTCFKCRGRGVVYTVRALAAIAYARSLREVQVKDVKSGWLMFVESSPLGGKSGWLRVTEELHQGGSKWKQGDEWMPYWELTHTGGGHGFCYPADIVQAVPDKASLVAVRSAALSYQTGLTKAGTVRVALAKNGGR
jgi:hypothetical protein